MSKIFLLLMLMSTPDQPSVKYNAYIYFTEPECLEAKEKYMSLYNNRDLEYKSKVKTEAFCIPFDAFPLTTRKNIGA